MMKYFSIGILLIYSFSNFSQDEVISAPGEWSFEMKNTHFISCESVKQLDDELKCQTTKGGIFYRLSCPALEKIDSKLKVLNGSHYCYAQRRECKEPTPCAVLEEVVHLKGIDICQRGEIKKDRICPENYTYRIDHKQNKMEEGPVIDMCCQVLEIFSRPGVAI